MIQRRTVLGHDPQFQYTLEEELLADGKRRTLWIEGPIRVIQAERRSMRGVEDRTPFDHRGHLIAHRFGGPSHPASGNLVAMHGLINMSGYPWYQMEATIAQFLGDRVGHMRVEVQYQDEDTRPHAFYVKVVYANGMHSIWKTFNYNPYLSRPG